MKKRDQKNLNKKQKKKLPKISLSEKFQVTLNFAIKISLIIAILLSIKENNWMNIFVILLTLFLIYLPKIFTNRSKIVLPLEFQTIIVVFVYAGIFLGEIGGFYVRFWWWDSVLHFFSGIALGFIGFLILYVLCRTGKFKASPIWIVIFSFCFAITLGVIWEIFEFWMDTFFGLNMQRAIFSLEIIKEYGSSRIAIYDTMWDFMENTIGALIASILGYLYLKKGGVPIFNNFVNNFENKNPHLFIKRNSKSKDK